MYEAKLLAKENNLEITEISKTDNGPFGMDIGRYSSMTKLLRVTSLLCRFLNRLKHIDKPNGPVQTSEIEQVEKLWIACIQRLHYSSLQRSIQEN